jgi:hypothetical protein
MRHWLKTTPLLLILLLVVGAPANAAILPGVAVDGPSNLIDTGRPDVDVAAHDSAALVYLKKDGVGPVNHPFVSRFVNGAWGPPQRVDGDSNQAASNVRIAVANGGKVVVAYSRGGDAVARISAAPGAAFGAERIVQAGGTKVDVDLSPNGNGYVVVESTPHIFAERLEGENWTEVGATPLNSDPTHEAGGGNRDVRVAASADGAGGAMAWGEALVANTDEDVFVRRLTGSTPGTALGTRLPAGSLPGSSPTSGKVADQPAVDIDAGGTIWVVYRQDFEYGATKKNRAIARPITGETVGAGQVVDNMGNAPTEGRDFQQIDVNAAGQGLLSHHGNGTANDLEWASLAGGTWTANGFVYAGDNGSVPQAIPALGENGSGLIAYAFKAATGLNKATARTTLGGLGGEIELSNPAFGALQSSLDASAGSGAIAAAAFAQQSGGDATTNRVVAAVVDLPQPAGGGNPPPPPPDTTAPDVTRFRITRKVFRAGGLGTVIKWSQSDAGTDTISFERRAKARWRKVRRKMRFQATAGSHRLRFRGRFDLKHPLKPGRYRMTLRARDAAGNVSKPDRVRFRLLPKKRP